MTYCGGCCKEGEGGLQIKLVDQSMGVTRVPMEKIFKKFSTEPLSRLKPSLRLDRFYKQKNMSVTLKLDN